MVEGETDEKQTKEQERAAVLAESKATAEELRKLNAENKIQIEEMKSLNAKAAINGVTEAGVPQQKPKVETPQDYAQRIMRGGK